MYITIYRKIPVKIPVYFLPIVSIKVKKLNQMATVKSKSKMAPNYHSHYHLKLRKPNKKPVALPLKVIGISSKTVKS